MRFPKEEFIGKNGIRYTLRSPETEDAEKMIAYLKATAEETEFGLSYPEEMDFTIQDEEISLPSTIRIREASWSPLLRATGWPVTPASAVSWIGKRPCTEPLLVLPFGKVTGDKVWENRFCVL